MDIGDFQRRIGATFGERDAARGLPSTVAWLAEEVGELAQAVRKGTREAQLHELGDVLAWLATPRSRWLSIVGVGLIVVMVFVAARPGAITQPNVTLIESLGGRIFASDEDEIASVQADPCWVFARTSDGALENLESLYALA